MKRLKSAIGLAVFTAVAFVVGPAVAADKKPNIVFILLENIGWGDFGVYGGTTPTPRIDALAHSGIRFPCYSRS